MIIIKTASKDTFVTDMVTQSNMGVDANFGQASTLDLFKIQGESKKVKSRSMLTLSTPDNGDQFTLTDHLGNIETFTIDANNNTVDNLISHINDVNNFEISAYKLDSNKILLQQNAIGAAGDTTTTVIGDATNRIAITPFRRFEHSAVLLTFDLKSIVDEHVVDLNNSIFSNDAGNASDFKAFLRLKDVGVASTSPKDFKLRLRVLNNDFNEGIGRDVIHFSDLGDANFKTINSLTSTPITWTTESVVSIGDVVTGFDEELSVKDSEDLVFDITSHVYAFMQNNNLSQTFVIDFSHENLFDEYTYFLKRLGSRNLSNRFNRPKIEIKVKDSKFERVNYSNKKRFLDNEETLYLTNLVNKKLQTFPGTTKLVLNYEDDTISSTNIRLLRIPADDSYVSITDSAGLNKTYGFKAGGGVIEDVDVIINTTNQDTIAKVLSTLQTAFANADGHNGSITSTISGDSINITQNNAVLQQTSFVTKVNDSNTSIIIKETKTKFNIFSNDISESNVNDYKGNTIPGIKKFTIANNLISRFNSSTQFQSDLSSNKKVKINFKYFMTSGGSDFLVKNEDIDLHLPETSEVDLYKKIRVVLNTQQKEVSADNCIKTLQFSFIDLAKQYDSVKVPIELTSEDLGEISYTMYNVDTGNKLLINDESFNDTSMFYNGKHYIANLYASEVFKNTRVGFEFEYTDPLSGLKKKISDKKLIVRFE